MPSSKAVRETALFNALIAKNEIAKTIAGSPHDIFCSIKSILFDLETIETALAVALESEHMHDNLPSAQDTYNAATNSVYNRSHQS